MAGERGRVRRGVALLTLSSAALFAPAACVIGPVEDPGCHADADCDAGGTCRAGACFRVTTSPSPAPNPEDFGVVGDAGLPD